jgi:pimeloyl-ACP methyl ester carboxylesterase
VTDEHIAASIKGARTKVYPDVAHMVSLERPEEFDHVLADFLAEVDATA